MYGTRDDRSLYHDGDVNKPIQLSVGNVRIIEITMTRLSLGLLRLQNGLTKYYFTT